VSEARPDAVPAGVVILAAGEGKRMKSALPKVLHPLLGRTLVGHVLAAAQPLGAAHTLVVIGHGRERVAAHLAEVAPGAVPVVQEQQNGTGHAVRVALQAAPAAAHQGTVIVLNGDVPLLSTETLTSLVAAHERAGNAATVLTADMDDPTGLGRVIRTADGRVTAIVEERDADQEQRAVREVNAGVYAFDGPVLHDTLQRLSTDNAQGEEYLTDCVGLLVGDGKRVAAHRAAVTDTLGCNDRAELARLRTVLRDRVLDAWMRAGVTVIDPASTWVDVTVRLAGDVTIHPDVQLHGTTTVGEGAQVGPSTTLTDTVVGDGVTVVRSHCTSAEIGARSAVGPYAYLRPGTVIGDGVKIGAYVEVKASEIGSGSKVPHLTYVGDATIGEQSNIGASSVFVNYDGVRKHRTVIGDHCRTGSDTMFVAPVTVGDGAYTAAGTVVREDIPPGALAVSGNPQRNIDGWVERRRPGTPAAEAAARARAAAEARAASTDSDA
jgi:bifunctional UDP-N-acetylglucosamine pyrophosphorylase/glucosamine-1-phosphate N-acetyltransferase